MHQQRNTNENRKEISLKIPFNNSNNERLTVLAVDRVVWRQELWNTVS